MKLDEVKNLIRKSSRRNDGFADEFLSDAQSAGAGGVSSQAWNDFVDKYFANDPDTLQNLGRWAKSLDSTSPYGTTGVLTSGPGCRCVTYYESDPYFDGGAGYTAP